MVNLQQTPGPSWRCTITFLVLAAAAFGGVLAVGLLAVVRVRGRRQEDLQMKQHVQRLA
jgi:hypothetical protein